MLVLLLTFLFTSVTLRVKPVLPGVEFNAQCRARPRLKLLFSRERARLLGDQIGLDKFCLPAVLVKLACSAQNSAR